MNRRIVVVGLLIAAACSKKSSAPGESPAAAPEKAGPATLTAAAFDKEYRSLDGLALLDKYQSGVVLTGTAKVVGEEESGSIFIFIDVDGKKWINATFTDKGAAVKAKAIKKGSPLKVTCQKVLGAADNYIMVGECALN